MLPEPLDQHVPLWMIIMAGYLPIEDVPPPVLSQSVCCQHSHLPNSALLALACACLWCDVLLLCVDRNPHAIPVDHRGSLVSGSVCAHLATGSIWVFRS
jgi:hypothetical protein